MAKSKAEYWLTEDGLILLNGWARDGLTDEQIAAKCNIVPSTLYEWKKKHPEISEALKKGKEIVDTEVENALLNNAKGYYYVEQAVANRKEVTYKDGKRVKEISEPVLVEVKKWKAAETTAQIFWLKNRDPSKWRDASKIEMSGSFELGIEDKRAAMKQAIEDIKRGD